MGQHEVMKVLKKENRGMTSKEIVKILNASLGAMSRILKNLYDHGEVSRKEIKLPIGYKGYEYKIK